jgi:hypothetical protein
VRGLGSSRLSAPGSVPRCGAAPLAVNAERQSSSAAYYAYAYAGAEGSAGGYATRAAEPPQTGPSAELFHQRGDPGAAAAEFPCEQTVLEECTEEIPAELLGGDADFDALWPFGGP